MQFGDILSSKPLNELEIEISPEHAHECQTWLQTQGCHITHIQGECYRICFPEGVREEIRFGTSGAYTRRTSVVFPSGSVLPKYVAYPINKKQQGRRVMLVFSSALFPTRQQGECCA